MTINKSFRADIDWESFRGQLGKTLDKQWAVLWPKLIAENNNAED